MEIPWCQIWTVWRMCEHLPTRLSNFLCGLMSSLRGGGALSSWKITPCWSRLGHFLQTAGHNWSQEKHEKSPSRISDGPRCALTQGKWGKSAHKFRPRVPKRVFFVIKATRPFATYPAPISTIFETTDVNRFPHAYTGERFPNFGAGNFPRPKNRPKYGTLGWGVCDRAAARPQLWAMGIISEASRHPKDVPIVCEFRWLRTYGLGAISPRKAEILPNSVPELT